MLAEPRRKQRFSNDPRGLNWSNDESKFGQKLMEKFGWSKGRGLGAKEDGETDPVSVAFKQDQRGMGCSKIHADSWVAHQDDFNSLLAGLQTANTAEGANTPPETAAGGEGARVLNLELKSKKSKRVHYGKFARGKDLSRAQYDDLDCIFGRRKAASKATSPAPTHHAQVAEASEAGRSETAHGVTTIHTGSSVAEYFARKMEELKKSRECQSATVGHVSNGPPGSPVDTESSPLCEASKKSKKRSFRHCDDSISSTASGDRLDTFQDNDKGKCSGLEVSEPDILNEEKVAHKSDIKTKQKKNKKCRPEYSQCEVPGKQSNNEVGGNVVLSAGETQGVTSDVKSLKKKRKKECAESGSEHSTVNVPLGQGEGEVVCEAMPRRKKKIRDSPSEVVLSGPESARGSKGVDPAAAGSTHLEPRADLSDVPESTLCGEVKRKRKGNGIVASKKRKCPEQVPTVIGSSNLPESTQCSEVSKRRRCKGVEKITLEKNKKKIRASPNEAVVSDPSEADLSGPEPSEADLRGPVPSEADLSGSALSEAGLPERGPKVGSAIQGSTPCNIRKASKKIKCSGTEEMTLECGFPGANLGCIAGYGRMTSLLVGPGGLDVEQFKVLRRAASKKTRKKKVKVAVEQ